MIKIDAHQHFWKFDAVRDSWINEDMKVIQRDFLPADLEPLLRDNGFAGSVIVQSDQSPAENVFQLQHADQYSFIKGVVGWVDLKADDLESQLDKLSAYPKLKGFRHVLQGEHPDFMLHPDFVRGLGKLAAHHFTYDILIFPQHLENADKLVARFPDQPFVVDHIAKPLIKTGEISAWAAGMKKLSLHPNVSCKISGLITEADWKNWKAEDFKPYLDVVFEAFGSKRVMFGSDWPVCLVAGSYKKVVDLVADYCGKLSADEQAAFWGLNATSFYKLTTS